MILFAIAVFSATTATVSAQEITPAASPPDAGSAFSVPLPNLMIVSSLILSLVALVKH